MLLAFILPACGETLARDHAGPEKVPSDILARSAVPVRSVTFYTFGGPVNAVAVGPDGTAYFGGSFTQVGPETGGGVPIDSATGRVAATFPKVEGTVSAALQDGAGGWFIGGTFTKVGGVARTNLAHLLANGSVDAAWDPKAEPTVHALALSQGIVYVGGPVVRVGGQMRSGLAAVNAQTGAVQPWNPEVKESGGIGTVAALAVKGNIVYAGGTFDSVGGQVRNNLAALDAVSGRPTPWDPNITRSAGTGVAAILATDSRVYAGGTFRSVGGQPRSNLVALDPGSGSPIDWNPMGTDGAVYALALAGGTLYAGGDFGNAGGELRTRLAAIDEAGGIGPFSPTLDGAVRAIAISGSTAYIGGDFSAIGSETRYFLGAVDLASGRATSLNPGANGKVFALIATVEGLFVGGELTSLGGVLRNGLAAFDQRGALTAWNPDVGGRSWTVNALAVSGGLVYVGGAFDQIGGESKKGLAAIDAGTGAPNSWNLDVSGQGARPASVTQLVLLGGTIFAGGDFSTIAGQDREHLAAIDATTGAVKAWNPSPPPILALAASGMSLYAGGMGHLAAFDTTTGARTGWTSEITGAVNAIAPNLSGGPIYVGGNFQRAGGQMRSNLAALDAVTGAASNWDPSPDGPVDAIALNASTVYAGGSFHRIGGQTRNYLGAVDANAAATGWDPNDAGAFPYPIASLVFPDASTLFIADGVQFGKVEKDVFGGENPPPPMMTPPPGQFAKPGCGCAVTSDRSAIGKHSMPSALFLFLFGAVGVSYFFLGRSRL